MPTRRNVQRWRELDAETRQLVLFHIRWGWWSLVLFLLSGLTLEMLHGFKIGWYLDVNVQARRTLYRLAHAHGGVLSLVQIAFAATASLTPGWRAGSRTGASCCLLGAAILIPAGFLLGGTFLRGGDPGAGLMLAPAGGLLLLFGVLLTARACGRGRVAGE